MAELSLIQISSNARTATLAMPATPRDRRVFSLLFCFFASKTNNYHISFVESKNINS
jgi:hypothetical protein